VDSIKRAVELARTARLAPEAGRFAGSIPQVGLSEAKVREVRLDTVHLEANRIVAHGGNLDQSVRYYDMLRTQVLQEMEKRNWQFLAVTSPTPGCGKTVTACNLAMSIARRPDGCVLLVDLDLRKPTVGSYLGLRNEPGIISVLEGQSALSTAIVQAIVGRDSLLVLSGSTPLARSSEWMASQTMAMLLETIKRDFRSHTVIFDLPPMLLGDDVVSILPRMDAVLLVAAVGNSTVADIKECQKHLQRTPVVRVLVNKVEQAAEGFYGYY
jgi:protein-tyrosine kinase